MAEGFIEYDKSVLPKINAIRRAKSQPDVWLTPTLDKGSVLFVTAESRNREPNSCYNCPKFNESDQTCKHYGSHIRVVKFTYGAPDKEIEYWPVCGQHNFGEPNRGDVEYFENLDDPEDGGLSWINAPGVGQKLGGANCGGVCGGDDCDYYMIDGSKGDEKWDYPQAFCRVLQQQVAAGDCCGAWSDDDLVTWQEAQDLLRTGEARITKPSGKVESDNPERLGFRRLLPERAEEKENGEENEREG